MRSLLVILLGFICLSGCAQSSSCQFSRLSRDLAAVIKARYPEAKLRATESSFRSSFETVRMTTSVKSDQKGNPIWHTGDAVWGDGFILELSLRKAPAQLYDVTPALSHGSNCDTYFGSAGLDDSDKIVQIGFFVGYNEPKEFSSSVIKAINHFTVPRNPHEGSAR